MKMRGWQYACLVLCAVLVAGCADEESDAGTAGSPAAASSPGSESGAKKPPEGRRPWQVDGAADGAVAAGQSAGAGARGGDARERPASAVGDGDRSASGRPQAGASRGGPAGRGQAAGRGGGDRAAMARRFRNRPVPVAVSAVQRGRVDAFYNTTTSLTAEEEAVVVARTTGVVETIFVEEGDLVKAGDALAQLDTRRLELEVARTQTNIRSLERAFKRSQQLMETKMISPDAFDQAQFELEREKATLALQQYELEEATVRAPIDGRITVRHIKVGNTLSPNNEAFEIKRADTIEAILNVPEKEMAKMAVGQYARVSVDALEDSYFEGRVDRIAPEVDAQTGTFRVTVALVNDSDRLKPGMFARVNVRYDTSENALLVSREAVVIQKNERSVFVVRDGLATRQEVITGYSMDGNIEIREGLAEGDEVVITGQGGLRDGASVRVVAM